MFAMDRESLLLGEAPSFQDVPRECLVVRPWSACRAKASQRQGCSHLSRPANPAWPHALDWDPTEQNFAATAAVWPACEHALL